MKRLKEKQKLHIPKRISLFYVTTNTEMVPELVHPKSECLRALKELHFLTFCCV